LLAALPARAEPPCARAERWVAFAATADLDPAFLAAARAHLAAELAPRGVAVCAGDDAGPGRPAARFQLAGQADRVIFLRIIDDATSTTVERRIDLSTVPQAGRALAFGLAADELLASSWTAPTLPSTSTKPPSTVVVTAPAAASESRSAPVGLLGVAASGQSFGGGPFLAGPELVLGAARGRLGIAGRAGLRRGAAIDADHGRIGFDDVHGALRLRVAVTPPSWSLAFGPAVACELARVHVSGEPDASAVAREGSGLAITAWLGASAAVRVGRALVLELDAGVGQALLPVRARDAGVVVGGVAGVGLAVALAAEVTF
jgi:hypothetical protein